MRRLVRPAWWYAGLALGVSSSAQPIPAEKRVSTTTPVVTLTAKTQRIAPDKTKLSITPKVSGETNFKLLDAAGKEISAAIARDGTIEAVVDPKRAYILTRPTPARQALSADGVHFPARYVTFSNTGAVNLGGLFLRPTRVPLTWDDQANAYVTELMVGYEFQDGAERPLAAPKTVTFFSEGVNARIQADTVEIKRSGVPGYQRVKLSTTEIGGETLFTARAGTVDEIKSSVAVRRELGALSLTLPSSEIAAFGVGSGKLTVSLLARDNFPLPAEQPMEIQLSSHRLRLPAAVELPAGTRSVEIEFRSIGYGADAITAQTGTFRTTRAIRLIFPVAAIVAAAGGGALGGAARSFRNRQRTQKSKPMLVRRLVEGVLVGIIFVGAAWTGLVTADMSTGVLSTPFGAFVLAALSGYVGCVILDRLTKKTFKNLEAGT